MIYLGFIFIIQTITSTLKGNVSIYTITLSNKIISDYLRKLKVSA